MEEEYPDLPLSGEAYDDVTFDADAWLQVPEMGDVEALALFRTTPFLHRSVKCPTQSRRSLPL